MSEEKTWAEFQVFWNAPEQEELRMSCAKGWAFEVWQASRAEMQGEPVAYISHTSEGDILGWERQFDAPSHTPLYTDPQPTPTMQGGPVASTPVAAQQRFIYPQKPTRDWSAWQPASINLDRPPWEIDSQGYEVEYRLLYDASQPTPDVSALVEALELISDTDPDEGTAWFHAIADKALAAYRKGEKI